MRINYKLLPPSHWHQRKTAHVRRHDDSGTLPDKGPTLATNKIGEILGNPSISLAYKRNALTPQTSNRGVRPHDSYEDLRDAFRENYLQQKKCIKDLVEIHHIKQRDGESTEDFVERYKIEIKDVKGASRGAEIPDSMHGINLILKN
ncbi:reverse transcriptase domain-containing protein [Tanacetum coccineum]